ncbi:hypothetical protein GP486_006637 [Trichoglossum hirsutum]|uniref:Uncharacterized protein n=1 Tax=Trichoglossum hirsutum TaxID=265104 RepID=A0A9P8IK02_9PEZI|nr:hypothetical protein GP486_006637 [Trichoglossum hirsutum]
MTDNINGGERLLECLGPFVSLFVILLRKFGKLGETGTGRCAARHVIERGKGTMGPGEGNGWDDELSWEMGRRAMAPLPLRIRKKKPRLSADSGVVTTETADANMEEVPPGTEHQQGCYWQSDGWQRFKDMVDSSRAGSVVSLSRASIEIKTQDDQPEVVGMDLEPLQRVRMGIFSDEGFSKHVEATGSPSEVTALGKLIGEVKVMGDVDCQSQGTTGKRRRTPSDHMSWFVRFLSDVESHQSSANRTATASPCIPPVLSNTFLASLWIRERMRDRWEEMYRVTLAPQRAEMRLRMQMTRNAADRQRVIAERRRLMRRSLKKVVASELSEIARALRQSLEAPAREIDGLYDLFLAQQQLLLLHTHASLHPLVSIRDQHHSSLAHALGQATPPLLTQLDAIDSLLDIGLRTVAAMVTRINRVGAKDVRDVTEREQEVKRRLENPGVAVGYLEKVGEDLEFLRLWAKTVEVGFKDVEDELAGFAGRVVDLYGLDEACVVFAECW